MTGVVEATAGRVRGSTGRGVQVFRGIPYAEPPVTERRFTAPVAVERWVGERDCTQDGPIPPQGPSRLKEVVGEFGGYQAEDCLSLTIWAPDSPGASRPVMVFVHGGAYVSGAGSLACYDAEALARDGDVVVVAPNFRIGALGFLYLPGVSEGNLGLLDLVLALRWVHDNIAAFAGDSRQVTIFGQSSGAGCIRALMAMPQALGLFRRAILQSAPLGRPDRQPAYAAEIGRRYAAFVGLAPDDRPGFEQVEVAKLLAAQTQLARSIPMPLGTNELPFTPVVDGTTVLDEGANWFLAEAGQHEAIVGFTAQEMAAFYAVDPVMRGATQDDALQSLRAFVANDADAVFAEYAALRGADATPADVLCDFHTDRQFGAPAVAYARWLAERGVRTWMYRFDWPSPAPGLGACHCIELAFVLDNLARWHGARMVAGADPAMAATLARQMLQAWAAFARTGNPAHPALPHWPPLLHREQVQMVFDIVPAVRTIPAPHLADIADIAQIRS
jgi:para-nitrobenzyl esterase